MKLPIDTPNEGSMRYFTPELYRAFNSSDDDVADAAQEQWEATSEAYHRHLGELRQAMPVDVWTLANLNLHDKELVGIIESGGSAESPQGEHKRIYPARLVLELRDGKHLQALVYMLAGRVTEIPADASWPYSTDTKLWLYDELDRGEQGTFVHRVLLSDGVVLSIPFHDAFSLPLLASSSKSKKRARSA